MSISKTKNLERKLNNIAQDATKELNNVCGSTLWESAYLGSIAAGLQAQTLGNKPITINKIIEEINNL